MIQAPSSNLVMVTTTSTTPVSMAPTPLSSACHCHPSSRSRRHFKTMPACESVKETNTPTM